LHLTVSNGRRTPKTFFLRTSFVGARKKVIFSGVGAATMAVLDATQASVAGISVNSNGGFYRNGVPYDIVRKLQVVEIYQELCSEPLRQKAPSWREVGEKAGVSHVYAGKVIGELESGNGILDPACKKPQRLKGPGSRSFDSFDVACLIYLLRRNPTRSLESYRRELFLNTGTITSTSTICRFWQRGFDTPASLRKPNLIPIDKFKPENIERAVDYIHCILALDQRRLKFVDEKSLKGAEIFNRKVRRDPITKEVQPIYTDPDFRNTYTIIGFCGVDTSTAAFFFNINQFTNDSEAFSIAVEEAISVGFLKRGDIVVWDNAAIHVFGENDVLEDFLWEYFGIHVLKLPTRSPELNPIEQLWRTLVRRLKSVDMEEERQYEQHRVANQADDIMRRFTHEEVARCYRRCGYTV
jgi:hypothetical protein